MISVLAQYFLNILVAFDRMLNTLLGGNPDQSISQRLWKEYPNSILRQIVDFLFGNNHCEDAVIKDDDVKEVLK